MKRFARARNAFVCGLFLAAVWAGGCTPHGISKSKGTQLRRKVQGHGLIAGFEGLQPWSGHRADDLTKKVAKDLDLAQAATSGNSSGYKQYVIEAHANGQPIYIVGYSMGGIEARKLADLCKKESIPVDILFLLDPGVAGVFTSKVPDNVRKVVLYASGTYDSVLSGKAPSEFLEDPSKTHVDFEDVPDLNHMNLPSRVTSRIEDQIAADLDKSGRR